MENNEIVAEEEITSSFIPVEEEETGKSSTSTSKTSTVSINAAADAYNFLQQVDIANESKAFKSLKRKFGLLIIKN